VGIGEGVSPSAATDLIAEVSIPIQKLDMYAVGINPQRVEWVYALSCLD
ncbi:hypothetical protein M8C21_024641, partial [Ambrosia artemisiifolia]